MKNSWHENICEIAIEAGQKIMEVYRGQSFGVTQKADASPVTVADLAANEIIIAGIKKISADLIVSEEVSEHIVRPETLPSRFWLVDPLDGTKGFVERKDSFCVNIALIENHKPILGVIHVPVTGKTYSAVTDLGAFCDGQKIFNDSRRTKLIAVASGTHSSAKSQEFYRRLGVENVERLNSAIKLCRVAEGSADLYTRFGQTSEWDIASGHIILNEAGCRLLDMKTQAEVTYGKPEFLNNGFVACRNDLDLMPIIQSVIEEELKKR